MIDVAAVREFRRLAAHPATWHQPLATVFKGLDITPQGDP